MDTRGTDEHRALAVLVQTAVPFALELRTRFRQVTQRVGCVIPGTSGWGEFAPFADYPPEAASRWLDAALEAAFGEWPVAQRDRVAVNAIIPAVAPHEAAQRATSAVRDLGCTTIKLKIDGDLAQDEARVAAVRSALDAMTDAGRIRLDVNGLWSTEQALHDGIRLAEYRLEYIEQPTRDLAGLEALRERVPIAVDEGIRRDGRRDLASIADVAIIKVAPLGGVASSLAIAADLGMPVIFSGSLDSSIGLAAGIQAAACYPNVAGPCGFGTGVLFGTDLVDDPTLPIEGMVSVGRRVPDIEALARARAGLVNEDAMLDRLREAWWAGSASRWTGAILDAQDRAR